MRTRGEFDFGDLFHFSYEVAQIRTAKICTRRVTAEYKTRANSNEVGHLVSTSE